jgi:hypothetical protein
MRFLRGWRGGIEQTKQWDQKNKSEGFDHASKQRQNGRKQDLRRGRALEKETPKSPDLAKRLLRRSL